MVLAGYSFLVFEVEQIMNFFPEKEGNNPLRNTGSIAHNVTILVNFDRKYVPGITQTHTLYIFRSQR